MAAGSPVGPRADGESLLRSRKRNFTEAEVSALLRGVSARRKKLLAATQDKVPLWQRTHIWKQVTEAVNTASGFRNRRTPSEVKKKWSDIKIEAKKRLRIATEKGDDGDLRPMDKRILAILQQDQDPASPINLDPDPDPDQDCLLSAVKQEPDSGLDSGMDSGLSSGLDPGLSSGLDSGLSSGLDPGLSSGLDSSLSLPTIINVTTVKSEPLLSESDPSSSSTSASMEHAQINPFTERSHHDNHTTQRTENVSFTEHAQMNHFPEHAQMNHTTEHAQMNHTTEHAQMNHTTEHAQMNHFTEHAQMNHFMEHAQCTQPNLVLLLLQNQQQILDTLRNMAQTFSQINSSLKDISHSLKNR